MATELIELVEVTTYSITLKFGLTLKTSSILNSAFVVEAQTATPTTLVDPFNTIDLETDYNSISRVLTLYWADGALSANTEYELTVTNLKNAYGTILDDTVIIFTTGDDIAVTEDDIPEEPEEPVIVDNSLILNTFSNLIISESSLSFRLVESNPIDGDYYLPADYLSGRITLTFSEAVAISSVTSANFRVQKKELSRAPSRWENLEVELSSDGEYIYIDLPSVDHYPELATPSEDVVYNTEDYEYFSENYKYRVLVAKEIAADAATPTETLLADTQISFAGVLSPLYLNPDELVPIFPEATELEIAEAIWITSVEMKEILRYDDDDVPTPLVLEYIKASAACQLSRLYSSSMGDEYNVRLGDLSVTTRSSPKSIVNRGNASTWCELAAALRTEVLLKNSRAKTFVAGSDYYNPIPERKIRREDLSNIPREQIRQGLLDGS